MSRQLGRYLPSLFLAVFFWILVAICLQGSITTGPKPTLAGPDRLAFTALAIFFTVVTTIRFVFVKEPLPGHCPKCGYDLSGITAETCPECGAPSQ